MQNQVIADIEIEDQKIEHYTSVVIRQQFNAHHEFAIRVRYDVLENIGSFSLSNVQKLIGKLAIIKLMLAESLEVKYEFRGLVCEIGMEQSDNFRNELVLKGYSPTILLENGPNFISFYQKNLQQIVQQLTQPVAQSNCRVNISPQYQSQIKYICQYRESTFHFLNRLSADFGEWFYYDGVDLYFGKPSSSPNIEIAYGEDIGNIQFKMRILPLTFSNYSYLSKDDKLLSQEAPQSIDGLDKYASYALRESNKIFSEPVSFPIRQRVESKSELDAFVKQQKTAMAADLEVLSGRSDNPAVCIGAIADVKIGVQDNFAFKKEECGTFLITSIEHHVGENGKYYNYFEGMPSGIEVVPVKNVIMPIAEPQIATVKDNNDPDKLGRIRVQMLWQQRDDLMTDWLRVMTPDAGSGKNGGKNRGFVFIPEIGDQVLICFRYNNPDRPFVLGSVFHGKSAGGGGENNGTKVIETKSGVSVILSDKQGSLFLNDAQLNSIYLDGAGNISINSAASIQLSCNDENGATQSSITLNVDGSIKINGKNITVTGSENATIGAMSDAESSGISIDSGNIGLTAASNIDIAANSNCTVGAGSELSMGSPGTVNITAEGETNIQGEKVNLN